MIFVGVSWPHGNFFRPVLIAVFIFYSKSVFGERVVSSSQIEEPERKQRGAPLIAARFTCYARGIPFFGVNRF